MHMQMPISQGQQQNNAKLNQNQLDNSSASSSAASNNINNNNSNDNEMLNYSQAAANPNTNQQQQTMPTYQYPNQDQWQYQQQYYQQKQQQQQYYPQQDQQYLDQQQNRSHSGSDAGRPTSTISQLPNTQAYYYYYPQLQVQPPQQQQQQVNYQYPQQQQQPTAATTAAAAQQYYYYAPTTTQQQQQQLYDDPAYYQQQQLYQQAISPYQMQAQINSYQPAQPAPPPPQPATIVAISPQNNKESKDNNKNSNYPNPSTYQYPGFQKGQTQQQPSHQYTHSFSAISTSPELMAANEVVATVSTVDHPYMNPTSTFDNNSMVGRNNKNKKHRRKLTADDVSLSDGKQEDEPEEEIYTNNNNNNNTEGIFVKPRVTTTMWEDERTICYQVEANGVSVVRRADNDMINGTKLLNVTKMTRGRRDGILKSEKIRHVVKIGSMHLKGVWVPFERARLMAGREHILDLLYPLFVRDIESVLKQTRPVVFHEDHVSINNVHHHQVQDENEQPQIANIPTTTTASTTNNNNNDLTYSQYENNNEKQLYLPPPTTVVPPPPPPPAVQTQLTNGNLSMYYPSTSQNTMYATQPQRYTATTNTSNNIHTGIAPQQQMPNTMYHSSLIQPLNENNGSTNNTTPSTTNTTTTTSSTVSITNNNNNNTNETTSHTSPLPANTSEPSKEEPATKDSLEKTMEPQQQDETINTSTNADLKEEDKNDSV